MVQFAKVFPAEFCTTCYLIFVVLINTHYGVLYMIILGTAQIINRGDLGEYGAVFKIIFVTTKEYMNKRTCFAFNGSSDYKVTPQGIFPDITQFSVRSN